MRGVIKVIFILFVASTISCTHYSTATRPEFENIIHAPIEVVWETALQILPTERITLQSISKNDYFISGRKHIALWSWGDNISIRLIPKGKNQSALHFGTGVKAQLVDWGHGERMGKHIFQRIKEASENKLKPG